MREVVKVCKSGERSGQSETRHPSLPPWKIAIHGDVSEMEAEFRRIGTRRDVVGPAERGKVIIERFLVRQVDYGKAKAPPVTVSIQKIVVAHCHVEKVPRRDALWIVVVVFRVRRGYFHECGPELGPWAEIRQRPGRSRGHAVASKPRLKLLIRGERH